MQSLYLYKKSYTRQKETSLYHIKDFLIRPWRLALPGEKISMKARLTRLFFFIISRGKAKVFYVKDNENVVHTSCVVPYCGKFSFMERSSYEIGPCYTIVSHRGRGIYPAVLCYITSLEEFCGTHFYMMISSENQSSVRGVEKAGFKQDGFVHRTRFLKKYYRDSTFRS